MIGLNSEPFSTSPDPKYFFLSKGHNDCLGRLEIDVRLRRGLSVIMGSVGVGKTTLSRKLVQSFEADTKYEFYLILDPKFESDLEFLQHLINLFQIESKGHSVLECRDILENFLLQRYIDEDRNVVLIIDEGQNLTSDYMEALRTLLNFETDKDKLLQLVIFAQKELKDLLSKHKNFQDRISFGTVLQPINQEETKGLIEYRLAQAGYNGEFNLFTIKAIQRIHKYTEGFPRRIISICHLLMIEMISADLNQIGDELVVSTIRKEREWHA